MSGVPSAPPERGLRDHVGVLRRRAPLIIGLTVLSALAALVVSLRQPTLYQARAEVLFQQEVGSVQDPEPDQMVQSKRLDPARVIQNETRVAGSQLVRDRVQALLGGSVTATAENVRDSDIIVITATAATPERAAEVANTWARAYVELTTERLTGRADAGSRAIDEQLRAIDERIAAIDATLGASTAPAGPDAARLTGERDALTAQRADWVRRQSQIQGDQALAAQNSVVVLSPATPPASPSQPALARNLALAVVAGLAFALLVAYAVDQLDDRIRSVDDLERSVGLPVLAVVPGATDEDDPRAIRYADPILHVDPKRATAVSAEPGADATVLLVPVGTRARRVRRDLDVLARVGDGAVGVALWTRDDAPPGAATGGGHRATVAAR